MATFLDIGLFPHFESIFIVLIVFLLLFGLFEYIKVFGEGKKGLHAIISLVVALMFLVYRIPSLMVGMMVPWFTVIIIFIFFTLLMVRIFNVGESDLTKLIKDANVYPWIIIFAALILFLALGSAFGQNLLEQGEPEMASSNATTEGTYYPESTEGLTAETTSTATPSFATNLLNTLRNPKVLGLLFVMLVGAFALLFLTKSPS